MVVTVLDPKKEKKIDLFSDYSGSLWKFGEIKEIAPSWYHFWWIILVASFGDISSKLATERGWSF